jgi:hypothetical protein
VTRNLSGSQCNLWAKEARSIHESLKSTKADTVATLVSRSMQHGRHAPLHDGTCVRENREIRGGRSQRTCRARATSNQAFVDVIIARKRAPSHRVFVAQVFCRNIWGERRRRHRFSAFWKTWTGNWTLGNRFDWKQEEEKGAGAQSLRAGKCVSGEVSSLRQGPKGDWG